MQYQAQTFRSEIATEIYEKNNNQKICRFTFFTRNITSFFKINYDFIEEPILITNISKITVLNKRFTFISNVFETK